MSLRRKEKQSLVAHSSFGGGGGGGRGQHSERNSQMSSQALSQQWMFPIFYRMGQVVRAELWEVERGVMGGGGGTGRERQL